MNSIPKILHDPNHTLAITISLVKKHKYTRDFFLHKIILTIVQKAENNKSWQGYGEMELSSSVGGNEKWYGHFGKTV